MDLTYRYAKSLYKSLLQLTPLSSGDSLSKYSTSQVQDRYLVFLNYVAYPQ